MSTTHARIWVGVDAGKGHHWAVALDVDGETLFSTKVITGEAQILTLIETARERAGKVRWAVDTSGRSSTLLLALPIAHGQQVVYVPGRTVNRMSAAYKGEGKTDARDARVIADQACMRRDFAPLDTPPELVSTLQLLTRYRADLITDRVRLVNRLRDLLVGISPALERTFDYSAAKGPVVILTEYQTPAALRRIGVKRLTTWLERRKVRAADDVATRAVEAAQAVYGVPVVVSAFMAGVPPCRGWCFSQLPEQSQGTRARRRPGAARGCRTGQLCVSRAGRHYGREQQGPPAGFRTRSTWGTPRSSRRRERGRSGRPG